MHRKPTVTGQMGPLGWAAALGALALWVIVGQDAVVSRSINIGGLLVTVIWTTAAVLYIIRARMVTKRRLAIAVTMQPGRRHR